MGLGLIDEGAQKKNKKKRKKKKKMIIKSKKTKWVTLSLLTLSVVSLLAHLSVTKFSTVNLVQYSAMDALRADFANVLGTPTQVCVFVFSFSFIHCFLSYSVSLTHIDIYEILQIIRNKKKIWGLVQSLQPLQPYANPRSSSYPGNLFALFYKETIEFIFFLVIDYWK